MTDLDRLLSKTLQEAGENYEPSDQAEARRRFLERARRRRWYGFAQVAAVAGVGLAAFLFFTRTATTEDNKVEPKPQVAGAPEVVARVEVGGEPVSIDAAPGQEVWVAGKDRIVAIDSGSNEESASVNDLPADEVAAGDDVVWVAHDGLEGTVTEVQDEGLVTTTTRLSVAPDEDATWDIAADGGTVWAVDGVTGVVRAAASLENEGEGAPRERDFHGLVFSDIAVDEKGVWVLDEVGGLLLHLDPVTMDVIGDVIDVPEGHNADLIAGFQYVYLSPGTGTLYQITPPGTTDMVESDLGDSYMDLTVHEKSVWALVNVDEEHKQLFEINPDTMEVVGEPLEIEGDANDVVAEAGSVWVADGRGEVLRIEPSREADNAPAPVPDESQAPAEDEGASSLGGQIVFVYSQDGDLFAETKNSGSVQLTDTPEIEEHPSVSADGSHVVFERHGGTPENQIVELDLQGPNECCYRGDAVEGTFASGDTQIAWVKPATNGKQAQIAIGPLSSEDWMAWPVSQFDEPFRVTDLAFDHTNQYLWFLAGYESSDLYVVQLDENEDAEIDGMGEPSVVNPSDEGADYLGPSVSVGLNVLRVCCGSSHTGGFTEIGFGAIEVGTDRYTQLQDLTELPLDPDSDTLFTTYLGGYKATTTPEGIDWELGSNPTWLVGDGARLFVIEPATGRSTDLGLKADGGVGAPNELAINPHTGAD